MVSLGLATIFIFSIQQFTMLVEKNEAEENHLWITYYTRLYLGQAVRVNDLKGSPPGNIASGGRGSIRTDFDVRALTTGNEIIPFGIFERENGIRNSEFEATGIFLKGINSNAGDVYNRSYAIIFHLGCPSSPCLMNPDRNNLFYDRISRFEVLDSAFEDSNPGGTGGTNNLKNLTIRVSTRYFNTSNQNLWCFDESKGVNCTPHYRDITSDIQITLRNNILGRVTSSAGGIERDERAHGGLYYYFPFLPRPRR